MVIQGGTGIDVAADGANDILTITAEATASTFEDLTDTPSSLGDPGQVPAVNAGRTALEFVDQSGGGITDWDSVAAYSEDDIVDNNGGIFRANTDIAMFTNGPVLLRNVSFVRFVDFNGTVYAHIRFTSNVTPDGVSAENLIYNFGGQQRILRVTSSNVIFAGQVGSDGTIANLQNWYIDVAHFTDTNGASGTPPGRADIFGFSVAPTDIPAEGRLFDSHSIQVIQGLHTRLGNPAPGISSDWDRLNELVKNKSRQRCIRRSY